VVLFPRGYRRSRGRLDSGGRALVQVVLLMVLFPIAKPTFLLRKVGECVYTILLGRLTNNIVVLSRLVCMSLTEDRYGVVQRDIPRILEALLAFLTALEDAQKEIPLSEDAEEAARAIDVYSRPADGTRALSPRKVCH